MTQKPLSTTFPLTRRLVEYQTAVFPPHAIPTPIGHYVWQRYDQKWGALSVTFPSPKSDHQWQIVSHGWVGHIPLPDKRPLLIDPRIPLNNLFDLWAMAYGMGNGRFLSGRTQVQSLPGFYDFLAHMLGRMVLNQAQKGFYQTYQTVKAKRPFVRGRLLFNPADLPHQPSCQYDEPTTNVIENQLLATTLQQIGWSPLCQPDTRRLVRQAFHVVRQIAEAPPLTAAECYQLTYHPLNQAYAPLHALCRFFLAQQHPTHQFGPDPMQPFLIHMPQLFEQFVAEWLKTHLPQPWQIKVQETVLVGQDDPLRFEIDMVLYDAQAKPTAVLDTKYKTGSRATPADIHQIIAYAKVKRCPHAILIYPQPLETALDVWIDDVHLQSISFDISNYDLPQAGAQFLAHLKRQITPKNDMQNA